MLEAYKKLESLGVIGKMMKVDKRGNPVIDLTGEIPGTLVTRPFFEFPKVIRRFKSDGTKVEIIVNSKNEELKLLAENPDVAEGIPQSPLERERDALAKENAEQNKVIGVMQRQMEEMMAKMASLSQAIDQRNAENVALGTGKEPIQGDTAKPSGKGIEALVTGTQRVPNTA